MTIQELRQDYERRLATIDQELKGLVYVGAWDYRKGERLTVKKGCYQTFLAELNRVQHHQNEKDAALLCEIIKGARQTKAMEDEARENMTENMAKASYKGGMG